MNTKRKDRVQRILLIDDCEEDRARVRSALMQGAPERRYHFLEADNGESGLELCLNQSDPIDCVIVDLHMPRLSGNDFLEQIRRPTGVPMIPIVVLTGSTMNNDAGESLQLGAQDYITKDSIYPSVLFRVVDNAIERHELLKEVHESRQSADAANQAKSSLVGSISHEIRTPMTAVLGICELLLESDLSVDQEELVRTMRDNGQYLVEILNDLLDLSKLEAGKLEVDEEAFELRQLFARSIELMRVRAKENKTTLSLDFDESLPAVVSADPIRVRQVVLNLISNAIKFCPGGDVNVRVRTQADKPSNPFFLVEVVDNGCGIPRHDLERIFLPFIQSETKGKAKTGGGTGLGLAICRRLVMLMGGSMHVESEVDQGSTFSFTVPLRPAEMPAPAESERPPLSASIEELLQDCKFLIAEDTAATQMILKRIIEAAGGKTDIVASGVELLDRVRSQPNEFTAVITDIQMPEMDGLEATEKIRQFNSTIPIVVLTADAVSETKQQASAAGANDVLTKPIVRRDLLETLARYCDIECDSDCN
ncbi:response regulator [Roseiconus lacunae]|uniref:histidine kinase n=1 Tax=Roseiconus lacunae TaxID=2605694 RepID=A0ABT7PG17_9BACT|nr:hybrid sensor histidine kinase/response regulator [Roseiconus lacunae]MDM4015411.1 response regulator [Roseiconus lacunae]WRQ52911.1 response regulator [Stieleria sp. HD01]